MEQHPVPRNITGFQFRLIGDMTIRQFAYLAGGCGLAFVIFKAAPFPFIINISLTGLFALSGFAFAFVPIQERPLDKWLAAFIKSIFAPTQYLWQKSNYPPEILMHPLVARTIKPTVHIEAHREAKQKLHDYLATLPQAPSESLDLSEKNFISKTMQLFASEAAKTVSPIPVQPVHTLPPTPVLQPVQPMPNIPPAPPSQQAPKIPPVVQKVPPPAPPVPKVQIQAPIAPKPEVVKIQPPPAPPVTNKPEMPGAQQAPAPTGDFDALKKKLSSLSSEKEFLAKELKLLQEQLSKIKGGDVVKPVLEKEKKEPTIKTVTVKTAALEFGMLGIPKTPNMIVGIVKDPTGKLMPNIILTVKDKSGLPLRALKTNKLGQFSIATPLPNGTYLLELEDPMKRFAFDIAEIALSGIVTLPIEIVAKGEKELMREKLTKELFGSANI